MFYRAVFPLCHLTCRSIPHSRFSQTAGLLFITGFTVSSFSITHTRCVVAPPFACTCTLCCSSARMWLIHGVGGETQQRSHQEFTLKGGRAPFLSRGKSVLGIFAVLFSKVPLKVLQMPFNASHSNVSSRIGSSTILGALSSMEEVFMWSPSTWNFAEQKTRVCKRKKHHHSAPIYY